MPVAAQLWFASRTINTFNSIGTSTRGVRIRYGYQVATVRGVMPCAAAKEIFRAVGEILLAVAIRPDPLLLQ